MIGGDQVLQISRNHHYKWYGKGTNFLNLKPTKAAATAAARRPDFQSFCWTRQHKTLTPRSHRKNAVRNFK
jgi:hypothetical protein